MHEENGIGSIDETFPRIVYRMLFLDESYTFVIIVNLVSPNSYAFF